jgi:hypothetical protein
MTTVLCIHALGHNEVVRFDMVLDDVNISYLASQVSVNS